MPRDKLKQRMALLRTAGKGERELVATAKAFGIPVEPQVQVGPWFVDMVVSFGPVRVAIEVDGREHARKERTAKDRARTAHILNTMCLFRVSSSDACIRPKWCLVEAAKSSFATSWLKLALETHVESTLRLLASLAS